MMRFVTNCDHAHLSEKYEEWRQDFYQVHKIMGFCYYASGADTHIAQFADKSYCKKPRSTCGSYLDQHAPGGFSIMQLLTL